MYYGNDKKGFVILKKSAAAGEQHAVINFSVALIKLCGSLWANFSN